MLRKQGHPHLSMLDLVSAILLRLATRKPEAPPRWPLFMKLPMARTTSSICFRRLLCVSSREASRMAGQGKVGTLCRLAQDQQVSLSLREAQKPYEGSGSPPTCSCLWGSRYSIIEGQVTNGPFSVFKCNEIFSNPLSGS